MQSAEAECQATPFQTLATGYMSKGDVLYIPAGSLIFEKAINQHVTALRVPVMAMSSYGMMSLEHAGSMYPERLSCR